MVPADSCSPGHLYWPQTPDKYLKTQTPVVNPLTHCITKALCQIEYSVLQSSPTQGHSLTPKQAHTEMPQDATNNPSSSLAVWKMPLPVVTVCKCWKECGLEGPCKATINRKISTTKWRLYLPSGTLENWELWTIKTFRIILLNLTVRREWCKWEGDLSCSSLLPLKRTKSFSWNSKMDQMLEFLSHVYVLQFHKDQGTPHRVRQMTEFWPHCLSPSKSSITLSVLYITISPVEKESTHWISRSPTVDEAPWEATWGFQEIT